METTWPFESVVRIPWAEVRVESDGAEEEGVTMMTVVLVDWGRVVVEDEEGAEVGWAEEAEVVVAEAETVDVVVVVEP